MEGGRGMRKRIELATDHAAKLVGAAEDTYGKLEIRSICSLGGQDRFEAQVLSSLPLCTKGLYSALLCLSSHGEIFARELRV